MAASILKSVGWKVEGRLPEIPKYVLIGAPHTSNWDFPFAMLTKWALGFKFNWIGKDSLFRWPLGGLMRRLGGIPVNRRIRTRFIDQMISAYNEREKLVIVITPEGTRSKTEHWKTGFYYIALGAHVPIVMGYIDYERKVVGIGPIFHPSGDIAADIKKIAEFYADKKGKFAEKQGGVRIRSKERE